MVSFLIFIAPLEIPHHHHHHLLTYIYLHSYISETPFPCPMYSIPHPNPFSHHAFSLSFIPDLYHGTFIVSRHCLLFQSFSLSYKPDLIPVLYSRPHTCPLFQTLSLYYIPDLFPVLYSRPYICSLFQTFSLSFIPALIPVPVLFPVL